MAELLKATLPQPESENLLFNPSSCHVVASLDNTPYDAYHCLVELKRAANLPEQDFKSFSRDRTLGTWVAHKRVRICMMLLSLSLDWRLEMKGRRRSFEEDFDLGKLHEGERSCEPLFQRLKLRL